MMLLYDDSYKVCLDDAVMGAPLNKGINCVPLDDCGNGMHILFVNKDHHSGRVTDNLLYPA